MPLESLREADLELILTWRNAPAVRRAMYSHHEISLEEHRAWFQQLGHDSSRRWCLFRDQTGIPQGVVYFTDIDLVQSTAFWGFYASPRAPFGTGLAMALEALDFGFFDLGLYKLSGEALASNGLVLNLNRVIGFAEEGRFKDHHYDGGGRVDIVRFGLLARDWPERRERLQAKLITAPSAPPV
jgi:UDP-4-amino-4,6-dideoxy-N-acetyl-beta-L-altrosamine N-acetyltransferase